MAQDYRELTKVVEDLEKRGLLSPAARLEFRMGLAKVSLLQGRGRGKRPARVDAKTCPL